MMPKEEQVQEQVRLLLEKHELYPKNIIYTYEYGGLLAITFLISNDLDDLLKLIEYKSLCDKSDISIAWKDNNTILFYKDSMRRLYEKL